jgi:hypothetical protein
MQAYWGRLLIAFVVMGCFGLPAQSAPITKLEQQQCSADYHKFCGDYGLDTPALRTCMDKAGHGLSKGCVEALIDAGEVSRAEVNRRKKSGH